MCILNLKAILNYYLKVTTIVSKLRESNNLQVVYFKVLYFFQKKLKLFEKFMTLIQIYDALYAYTCIYLFQQCVKISVK